MSKKSDDGLRGRNCRVREGQWHYRFKLGQQEYSGNTGLDGTKRNQKAAEQRAQEEIRRVKAEARRSGPVSFDAAAAEFINWCKTVEYRSKKSTAGRIATSFASAVAFFGALPLQRIDAAAIERYKKHRLEEHGVRDITLRHDIHALSIFFKRYAPKQGWVQVNPLDGVSVPSDIDAIREHVITSEEEELFFATAEKRHAEHCVSHPEALPNLTDLARLLLDQGARPEELLALRKDAFDAQAGTLRIAGGKSRAARRTLVLTAASSAILARRAELPGLWMFPSDRNKGRHLTKLSGTHDKTCIEAGVSFVLYDFRHTFATRAIEAGVPVAVVAAILGHSSLRTIHRYVHPTSEAQREAMERYEAAGLRRKLRAVG
jgi:integrase